MLTIGQVARRADIRTSTLRYYEEIGLLPPPARVSDQRRYDEPVFRQLGLIKLAQRAGLSIAEIHTLLHDFPESTLPAERWRTVAEPKLAEVQALMEQLRNMERILEQTLECQCSSLVECGEAAVKAEEGALNAELTAHQVEFADDSR